MIAASEAGFAVRGFGLWSARVRGEAGFIGFAGLREIEAQPGVEVRYGLAPARWGRGFTTEASRAVLAHGFQTVGLARIEGRTDTPYAFAPA